MRDRASSDEETIRGLIRRINDLWSDGRYDEIGDLISEQAVMAPPGVEARVRGREAYVRSYRDYDQAATTHEYSPGDPQIDVVGDVAVAVCPFFIAYELEGATYEERGHEMLVLSRTAGEWRVVWRTVHTGAVGDGGG